MRAVSATVRLARALPVVLALAGCADLAPLREPPLLSSDEPARDIATRDEALARLGPPAEVRVSDVGEVLVYRRLQIVDKNPARYYGEDRGERLNQYERLLLYLDQEGRVVRWSIEPE
jgi:hypothetical protein